MKRAYRRRIRRTSRRCATEIQVLERPELAAGNVTVELPVSLAEAVEGVTEEIEQLAGQSGVLIMPAASQTRIAPILTQEVTQIEENSLVVVDEPQVLKLADFMKKAGDGIRTHDVQLGKLAFYH